MNKTQIAKALREAAFAPSKQGPLKVIADVGNLDYYIRRAMESLSLSLTAITVDQRVAYLNTALSLIALAKVKTQTLGDSIIEMRSREEVFGEVDKPDEDGEVQGTGDSVPPVDIFGDILDTEGCYKGSGQVPEAVQSRPEAAKEAGYDSNDANSQS